MRELKKETKIGLILIIIAILVGVISLVSYSCSHDNEETIDKAALKEKENEIMLNEILSNGTDSSDIKKEEIKNKLNIEITMSKNVEMALGNNRKELEDKMIDFLIENDLSTGLTQVTSTEIVTIDYRYNEAYAEFNTNDKQGIIIIVEYRDNKYHFNFR